MLVLSAAFAVPAIASLIPIDKRSEKSLDGAWRFKLEQAKSLTAPPVNWETAYPNETPEEFEQFFTPDYREDSSWDDLAVPSNWEMPGYSPATYYQPDNVSGFYRKWFEAPAEWAGRLVKVNFDAVQNGAEIWLNGKSVKVTEPSWGRENYHESGWTAWQADLTPYIKFGEKNLLALRVAKNTKSSNLDSGDYFFLGGIHRTVTLFSVPVTHIEDLTVRTNLLPGGKAEVKIDVVVAGISGNAPQVTARLEGIAPLSGTPDSSGHVELKCTVDDPRLWSAEFPNLYGLSIELKDANGNVTEEITRRIGIREITIKDGVMLVNGRRVKLTGICRHDVYPTEGTAVGEELWLKDLKLMKNANINSIRTSHYPYGSGFYDLCDEMGFYVIDELPYCWCPTGEPEMAPAFLQRARETIARDKNHACVIIWGIGNENHPGGSNLQLVADTVKAMDDTRPRLVSELNADQFNVEFDDRHYTPPAITKKAAEDKERRAKWPIIYTENPNVWDTRNGADYGCLDHWVEVMKRTWDVIWEYDVVTGSFLWEWQDRAVADKNPTKLYWYDPVTGMNYLKTKGIVDGWRNPRADYYHVKMVHSPVVVEPGIDLTSKPGSAIITIANRYSFTNLSELNATWHLLRQGKVIESGTAHFDLAPMTSGKVEFAIPTETAAKADALRIDFDHPCGWNVVRYQFVLREPVASEMNAALPEGLRFPKFNLVANLTVNTPSKWLVAYRFRAKLVNVKTEPEQAGSLLSAVSSMDADIMMEPDPKNIGPAPGNENRKPDDFQAPASDVVLGHVHAEFANGEFKYHVEWTGERTDIQELGWSFEMPAAYDRFSWKREALWSYYPDTHIGRPEGTALPDTADVHLTKITRPDAFDFNSTKYHCNRATLTNAEGKGLRLEFTPGELYQVRADFGPDGTYLLKANKQCSPPRDISTHAVPDLYMELQSGSVVEGSFRVGSEK